MRSGTVPMKTLYSGDEWQGGGEEDSFDLVANSRNVVLWRRVQKSQSRTRPVVLRAVSAAVCARLKYVLRPFTQRAYVFTPSSALASLSKHERYPMN